MEDDKVLQNEPLTEYGLDATGTVAAEKAEYLDQVPLNADEAPQDEDENLPKSSIENIIPLQNLKRGWFTISAFVAQTASAATAKANEALNSEEFLAMKQKASDAVAPAWEKTVEVAAPIWEKTKTTVSVVVEKTNETAVDALEKTKESMAVMAEQMKPTVETVRTSVWENIRSRIFNDFVCWGVGLQPSKSGCHRRLAKALRRRFNCCRIHI